MAWLRPVLTTLILSLLFSLSSAIAPAEAIDTPVSISGPAFPGIAPVSARFKIQIQLNPENRLACIVLDSENFYTSQCWDLNNNGSKPDPVTWWFTAKDLPGGEYTVVAAVTRSDKSIKRAIMRMEVQEGLPFRRE
jgi:hypothetical protein